MTSQSGSRNGPGSTLPSTSVSIYDGYPLLWHEIRLLDLAYGDWNDPIECRLRTVSLEEQPSYRTLSYTWDPIDPKHVIQINAIEFEIGSNLYHALKRLRAQWGEDLCIWIDAICINQANTSEKNRQVPLMAEIYSHGEENFVWLGELEGSGSDCSWFDVDDTEAASPAAAHPPECRCRQEEFADIDVHGAMSWRSPADVASVAMPILVRLASVQQCSDFRACRFFDSLDEKVAFEIFMGFYLANNPWFERIWVIQEVTRARINICFIGHVSFGLDLLYLAMRRLRNHAIRRCCEDLLVAIYSDQIRTLMMRSLTLNGLSKRFQEKHKMSLPKTCLWLPGRKATHDVDLVYGVLGLATEGYGISPDYDLSAMSVFAEVSRRYLGTVSLRESFWIFVYAPMRNRYPNMPSWAVDWTSFEELNENNSIYTPDFYQYYGEWKCPHVCEQGRVRFQEDEMLLRGRYIDSVGEVADATERQNKHTRSFLLTHKMRRIIVEWHRFVFTRHTLGKPYEVTSVFQQPSYTWATAFVKMMCGGVRETGVRRLSLLTNEDVELLLYDAKFDRDGLLSLLESGTIPRDRHPAAILGRESMQEPDLYESFMWTVPQVLAGKRMLLTRSNVLGFANHLVEPGDEIWMPEDLTRLLVLRPATRKDGPKVYTIVSTCYLESCMSGLWEGLELPCEELHII